MQHFECLERFGKPEGNMPCMTYVSHMQVEHQCFSTVVTKTWNDLKPPKTIYNHLQPPQKIQQLPTTTSKTSTTTHKQSKTI